MTGDGGRTRDAGRRFAEDVVEAMLWSAVEDGLLAQRPDEATEFLAGIEAWGADLLARWHAEVTGFLEAFEEDQREGRLERVRELVRRTDPAILERKTSALGPLRALAALPSA